MQVNRLHLFLRNLILIIVLPLRCYSFVRSGSTTHILEYSINEESDIGSFVGNLKLDAERKLGLLNKQTQSFELYDEVRPERFRVDLESGKLFVASRIDRESLCPKPEMTHSSLQSSHSGEHRWMLETSKDEMTNCEIHLSLLISSEFWINLLITVHDINDHEPYFPTESNKKSNYEINVAEAVPVGFEVPLNMAKDADVGVNAVKTYSLRGEDLSSNLFSLSHKPPQILNLVIMGELDADKKAVYKGEIVACDGGAPIPKCGSQNIVINVTDLNDNSPIFDKPMYDFVVEENVKIGTILAKLNATDIDSGQNGKVGYRFGRQTDDVSSDYFSLDESNGWLSLKAELNAKEHEQFFIPVIAEDGGPIPRTSSSIVRIKVLDINDHSPWIDFRSALKNTNEEGERKFSVSIAENRPKDSIIGFVIAGDDDLGNNSRVECALIESESFVLEHTNSANGREMYKLSTKISFDRENISNGVMVIKISCIDMGTPQKTAIQSVIVSVIDINEYPPEFASDRQLVKVAFEENQAPGSFVYKAEAFDQDALPKIHYFLSREAQPFFHIDSNSGLITSRVEIDREETPVIRFIIYATDTDNYEMAEQASISNLTVIVTDVNDNTPELTGARDFEIVENRPGYSDLLGQLTALDKDNDSNATVRYKLDYVVGNDNEPQNNTFMIEEKSGKIFTLKSLDRESQKRYLLYVTLYDLGKPTTRNKSEIITVNVLDENDNAPTWQQFIPSFNDAHAHFTKDSLHIQTPARLTGLKAVHSLGTLNITGPFHQGQRIGSLSATDLDDPQNGNVTYALLATFMMAGKENTPITIKNSGHITPNVSHLLQFDTNTGELLIGNGFGAGMKQERGSLDLYFRALDNGNPPLDSTARLVIHFSNSMISGSSVSLTLQKLFNNFNENGYTWILLAVLIFLTVCFTFVCLFIIIASAKRRRGACFNVQATEGQEKHGMPHSKMSLNLPLIADNGLILNGQLSVLGKYYQSNSTNIGFPERSNLTSWEGDRINHSFELVRSPGQYSHATIDSTLDKKRGECFSNDKFLANSCQLDDSISNYLYAQQERHDNCCQFSPGRQTTRSEVHSEEDSTQFAKGALTHVEENMNVKKERKTHCTENDGGSADSGQGASEDEPVVLENCKNGPSVSVDQKSSHVFNKFACQTISTEYTKIPRIAVPFSYCSSRVNPSLELKTFTTNMKMIGETQQQQQQQQDEQLFTDLSIVPPPPLLSSIRTCWQDPRLCNYQYGINNPQFEELPSRMHHVRQCATLPPLNRSPQQNGSPSKLSSYLQG